MQSARPFASALGAAPGSFGIARRRAAWVRTIQICAFVFDAFLDGFSAVWIKDGKICGNDGRGEVSAHVPGVQPVQHLRHLLERDAVFMSCFDDISMPAPGTLLLRLAAMPQDVRAELTAARDDLNDRMRNKAIVRNEADFRKAERAVVEEFLVRVGVTSPASS